MRKFLYSILTLFLFSLSSYVFCLTIYYLEIVGTPRSLYHKSFWMYYQRESPQIITMTIYIISLLVFSSVLLFFENARSKKVVEVIIGAWSGLLSYAIPYLLIGGVTHPLPEYYVIAGLIIGLFFGILSKVIVIMLDNFLDSRKLLHKVL